MCVASSVQGCQIQRYECKPLSGSTNYQSRVYKHDTVNQLPHDHDPMTIAKPTNAY